LSGYEVIAHLHRNNLFDVYDAWSDKRSRSAKCGRPNGLPPARTTNDTPRGVSDWEGLLNTTGNPKISTFREAMNEALTPEEIERFTAHLRPLVENVQREGTSAVAYLWAIKGAT
jgi:hypothetical protein